MNQFLVLAVPKPNALPTIREHLSGLPGKIIIGEDLAECLRQAHLTENGTLGWEQPSMSHEGPNQAFLDLHFDRLMVEPVSPGDGWRYLQAHPRAFPDLETDPGGSSVSVPLA